MELSKVLDGFTVADTLVIKAQVQVIHEKPARPFRCLEPQYRRELVRVYLTNVEGICRRFLEEKRETLAKLQEDKEKWSDMREFLQSANGKAQAALAVEKADALLKGIVKRFFNEKEVTSTLVMDALYCGAARLTWATPRLRRRPRPSSPVDRCGCPSRKTRFDTRPRTKHLVFPRFSESPRRRSSTGPVCLSSR